MLKTRRGISEMIAVVLILVIVSVAGTVLYRVSLATIGTQYTTLTRQVNDQTQAAEERFEIVAIEEVVEPENGIKLFIYNYSPDNTLDILIDKIYVNGILQTRTTIPDEGLVVQVHEIKSITIWTAVNVEKEYNIMAVSQRGISYEYSWEAI